MAKAFGYLVLWCLMFFAIFAALVDGAPMMALAMHGAPFWN